MGNDRMTRRDWLTATGASLASLAVAPGVSARTRDLNRLPRTSIANAAGRRRSG